VFADFTQVIEKKNGCHSENEKVNNEKSELNEN
jgi:hypothetical protein